MIEFEIAVDKYSRYENYFIELTCIGDCIERIETFFEGKRYYLLKEFDTKAEALAAMKDIRDRLNVAIEREEDKVPPLNRGDDNRQITRETD